MCSFSVLQFYSYRSWALGACSRDLAVGSNFPTDFDRRLGAPGAKIYARRTTRERSDSFRDLLSPTLDFRRILFGFRAQRPGVGY